MLTKILFTLAVIAGVFVFFRHRREGGRLPAQPAPVLLNRVSRRRPLIGWIASAVLVVMVAASALLVLHSWRDTQDIIYIRVIDAGSGNMSSYEAYRGDIEERSFRSIDGRHITLAATERLETSTVPGRLQDLGKRREATGK